MLVRKVLVWGTISFLIFFAAYRPAAVGDVIKQIGGGILSIVEAFGDFFSSLVP